MYIFNTATDVMKSDINNSIKLYLIIYIQTMLSSHRVSSLKDVGSIYYFDKNDYDDIFPDVEQILWEYTEIIDIKNCESPDISVVHGVVIKNNSCAIDVFVPMNAPNTPLKNLMVDCSDANINIVL